MKLENARLQVKFAGPEQLQSQRFDRTAMVAEVILDGRYAFCTPEQVLPTRRTTLGRGLCGEFVLEGAAEAAGAGQWFCKPGVGLMKQTDRGMPYDMWKQYELRPFPVTAERTAEQVIFRQKGIPCGGYAVDIEKAFSLRDNRLVLDISVRNAGERDCILQEYQHNFLSLEGMPVGEGYVLDLGCDKALPRIVNETLRQGDEITLPSAVRVEGTSVFWEKDMKERILYHRSEEADPSAPHRWTLRHLRSRVSVSEETGFCPSRIDIWSVEHCACPEFYQTVRLAPGEAAHWRRVWTFND